MGVRRTVRRRRRRRFVAAVAVVVGTSSLVAAAVAVQAGSTNPAGAAASGTVIDLNATFGLTNVFAISPNGRYLVGYSGGYVLVDTCQGAPGGCVAGVQSSPANFVGHQVNDSGTVAGIVSPNTAGAGQIAFWSSGQLSATLVPITTANSPPGGFWPFGLAALTIDAHGNIADDANCPGSTALIECNQVAGIAVVYSPSTNTVHQVTPPGGDPDAATGDLHGSDDSDQSTRSTVMSPGGALAGMYRSDGDPEPLVGLYSGTVTSAGVPSVGASAVLSTTIAEKTYQSIGVRAVNDAGTMVGGFLTRADLSGFDAWKAAGATTPTDLGSLGGSASAVAINPAGTIVGDSTDTTSVDHGVYWAPGATSPSLLDTLLPVNSGWTTQNAVGIDTAGDIIGGGTNGTVKPFLLRASASTGLSIADATVSLPTSGAVTAQFTVTLSPASTNHVTVDYATSDSTATVAAGDYIAKQGTLDFAPGQTTKTVDVTVNGDTHPDIDETFFVTLSNPTGGAAITGTNGVGVGRIVTGQFTLSGKVTDSTGAGVGNVAIQVTGGASPTSVNTDGLGSYTTKLSQGTYTVTAGGGFVPVASGDCTVSATACVVNLDRDRTANFAALPQLDIHNPPPFAKPPTGSSALVLLPVTLSGPSPNPVTVHFATQDGSALQGVDYRENHGDVTFPANSTTPDATPAVVIIGGPPNIDNRVFSVVLSNPTNATLAPGGSVGVVTIGSTSLTATPKPGAWPSAQLGLTGSGWTPNQPVSFAIAHNDGTSRTDLGTSQTAGDGTFNKTVPVAHRLCQATVVATQGSLVRTAPLDAGPPIGRVEYAEGTTTIGQSVALQTGDELCQTDPRFETGLTQQPSGRLVYTSVASLFTPPAVQLDSGINYSIFDRADNVFLFQGVIPLHANAHVCLTLSATKSVLTVLSTNPGPTSTRILPGPCPPGIVSSGSGNVTDPSLGTGEQTIPNTLNGNTHLGGTGAVASGGLTVNGPLTFDLAVLYVPGHVALNQGLRGQGALLTNATLTIRGPVNLVTDAASLLVSRGDLTLDPNSITGPATAPPCNALQNCQGASNNDPNGAAVATSAAPSGPVTATGTGTGGITVGRYPANPVGAPGFNAAGSYFDVKTSNPNTFGTVTIKDCDLHGGTTIDWWNPAANHGHGAWQRASDQTYTPGPPPCATVNVGPATSPNLTQLHGTVFVVEKADLVSVTFTGAITYANHGPLTGGDVHVTRRGGEITDVTGTAKLPGLHGGTATITVAIHRIFGVFEFGTIRVVDPSARLDQTTYLAVAHLPRDGSNGTHGHSPWITIVNHHIATYTLDWNLVDGA